MFMIILRIGNTKYGEKVTNQVNNAMNDKHEI